MDKSPTRVIAFDVRPQRLGYVIFEEPMRLVDWGVSRSRDSIRNGIRLMRLVEHSQPSVVVLRSLEKGGYRNRPLLRLLMRRISRRIHSAAISTVCIPGAAIKSVFRKYVTPTKENTARVIAARFPELAWQLPPHRRPWQPEHWRMPLFDAAALGIAYFALEVDQEGVEEMMRQRRSPFAGPLGSVAK